MAPGPSPAIPYASERNARDQLAHFPDPGGGPAGRLLLSALENLRAPSVNGDIVAEVLRMERVRQPSTGRCGTSPPGFDELLVQAEGTLDLDERREIMARIQTLMQEDGPIVQPVWRSMMVGYNQRVLNFRMHPTMFIFAEELAVAQG